MGKVQEVIDIDAIVDECGFSYGGELSDKDYADGLNRVLNALSKEVFNSVVGVRDKFLTLRSPKTTEYAYDGEYARMVVSVSDLTITYHLELSIRERLIDERHVSYYDPHVVELEDVRQLFNKYVSDLRFLLKRCSELTDYADDLTRDVILEPRQYITHRSI